MRKDTLYRKPYRAREYAFTREQLLEWRMTRRLSWEQIARKFGCDRMTVMHAAQRLGVPMRRPLLQPKEDEAAE